MKIYVGAPGTLRYYDVIKREGYGVMVSASSWRNVKPEVPFWALDNGAYSYWVNNRPFDEERFFKALEKTKRQRVPPDFVVVPDISLGGMRSFWFSVDWIHRLYLDNLYFAVQDGMSFSDVGLLLRKYDRVKGIFVGGSLRWKLRTGEKWVLLAHKYGKKCHIGRVGTTFRILWSLRIGADSIDSTTFVQGPPGGRFQNIRRAFELHEAIPPVTSSA